MRTSNLMLSGALAFAVLAVTPAFASDKADVLATVKNYDDAFNKNDMKAWNALCSDHIIIIDDFAPYVWQGANACTDWWNALDADEKKSGYSDVNVALHKALHVSVTGDAAYVVEPTTLTMKTKGKAHTDHGVWTIALQKQASGWRVTGWAWADH